MGHESIPVGMPIDELFLCARVGGLPMLELLSQEPRFGLDVRRELQLVPDLTPPFYPWRKGEDMGMSPAPTWVWYHLAALEFAVLHRRIDVAVLLVRLGADLLHTVDHVSIKPPTHWTITENCFRNLTPLHICALLPEDGGVAAAAALLTEAAPDHGEVSHGEHKRPQRQALLSARCTQGWATIDTGGIPEKEPWLRQDLTPLHLAIVSKNYHVAELLVDASGSHALAAQCVTREAAGDVERSFSALLLAFEYDLKDLHRRIAKKLHS